MNTASVDRAPWVIRAADDEVRIAFASHDVVVKGAGLGPLLHAIAAHRVARIQESGRSEHFPGQAGRFICKIVVRKMEAE